MREIDGNTMTPEEIWEDDDVATVDWKATPYEVLDEIDKLLKQYGLEIVHIDTHCDTYAWKLVQR